MGTMEPSLVTMIRDADYKREKSVRRPGDGMDFVAKPNNEQPMARKPSKKKPAVITATLVDNSVKDHSSLLDNSILLESLQEKNRFLQQHNDQLIEEKLKVSRQLSTQTQINNELKGLLVASIGEDLQARYESMIMERTQLGKDLENMQTTLVDDRELVEKANIEADVWRSKFLAANVMVEELTQWRSALYYKYRDSHTALQKLLEEHSKVRALSNATKRGLTKIVELLDSKDPSLENNDQSLTLVDTALLNQDLVDSLVEILEDSHSLKQRMIAEKYVAAQSEKEPRKSSEFSVEAVHLSPTEQLAQEMVLNSGIETQELARMRRDYLAHNRISHFLSTNYHATYNCCQHCTGPVLHL